MARRAADRAARRGFGQFQFLRVAVGIGEHDPLAAARRVYLRHGFRLIAEEPHRSFGVDLVGQTYALELAEPVAAQAQNS